MRAKAARLSKDPCNHIPKAKADKGTQSGDERVSLADKPTALYVAELPEGQKPAAYERHYVGDVSKRR